MNKNLLSTVNIYESWVVPATDFPSTLILHLRHSLKKIKRSSDIISMKKITLHFGFDTDI